MARLIHARRTPEGIRFREWLTSPDAYGTDAMTRDEMREHVLRERYGDPRHPPFRERALRTIDEDLDRAETTGTSSFAYALSPGPDAPWQTERCGECLGFHHAFCASAGGRCASCGEPARDRAHGPECAPARATVPRDG